MKPVEIKKGIFWVGAIDWDVRHFHGYTYSTKRGTTYNSYLIVDDKIALIDTVYEPFKAEMIEKIRQVTPPEKIDYIIANHVEIDHSGALPAMMKLCPNAKVFGTEKCKEGLARHYHQNLDFQVVKTNDELKLGEKTLRFIEAAMIHWPDSMFTYCRQQEVLFSNDAFGQHYATSERFDDEVDEVILMDESAKYYANILLPLGEVISRKLREIKNSGILVKMLAPSHGIIWRKGPAKIWSAYSEWAKNITKSKAVVVYETMYGSTAKMAHKIVEGITDAGLKVALFDINQSDRTEIIGQMLDTKGFVIGSSTHDNSCLPGIAGFMEFLKGLKPKNRQAAAFGSYGWAGGAIKELESVLKEAGIEIIQPSLAVKYVPDGNELNGCYEWGKEFAGKITKGGF